jgi:hypothetical protein
MSTSLVVERHYGFEFQRRRVDYRKGHPELENVMLPGETIEQRNCRLGLSDIGTVDTVFVQRSDGVITLLTIFYDYRYETYEGYLAYGHRPTKTSQTGQQQRIPLGLLQYSSYANSGSNHSSLESPEYSSASARSEYPLDENDDNYEIAFSSFQYLE